MMLEKIKNVIVFIWKRKIALTALLLFAILIIIVLQNWDEVDIDIPMEDQLRATWAKIKSIRNRGKKQNEQKPKQ